jgi:hypothetical protein
VGWSVGCAVGEGETGAPVGTLAHGPPLSSVHVGSRYESPWQPPEIRQSSAMHEPPLVISSSVVRSSIDGSCHMHSVPSPARRQSQHNVTPAH